MPEASDRARRDRVFLVVVDDSAEREVALKYAALRVKKSGGRVALLRVVEPVEQVEWAGIGAMMAEERREEAEALLSGLAAQVQATTGGLPILIVREGKPVEEVLALLEEDPRISILVLASATGSGGPGPLITALAGKAGGRLRAPMTIVPGSLDDKELDRVT
ncbi:MAG: universal stress protein [Acetobacteraceae bacterium]|nr:universal stress protein [Acetobacteraceae bacterium]